MSEAGEPTTAALVLELRASIERWRSSLPSGDQPGNTLYLGIADRAVALTSALLRDVTVTLMPDEPLRERATLGERIGVIQRVGRRRYTSCSTPSRVLVSKPDSRILDQFSAARNALAHQEGERIDATSLGRYRPSRVAEVLDLVEAISVMPFVEETVCVESAIRSRAAES